MDYTLNYPDLCHHPVENLIYERMVARDPQAKSTVGDLLKEHAHLGELTRKLAAALQNIARDSEIPRAWFESIVEDYLSSNERHIAGEEKIFFPQAALALRPEDWAGDRCIRWRQGGPALRRQGRQGLSNPLRAHHAVGRLGRARNRIRSMMCARRLALLGALLVLLPLLAGCVSPQSQEAMRVLSDIDGGQRTERP